MYNYDLTEELTSYVIDVFLCTSLWGMGCLLLHFEGKQERAVVSYCSLKDQQR